MGALRIRNGVDIERLNRLSEAADDAPAHIAVRTRWQGGVHSLSSVVRGDGGTEITVPADQPRSLLGNDAGATPEELALAAIGARFVETFALRACERGITLDALDVSVDSIRDASASAPPYHLAPEIAVCAIVVAAASNDDLAAIACEAEADASALAARAISLTFVPLAPET